MTMKVIKPLTVTDSVLFSSTALENDYPEWNAGTDYALGARTIRLNTHRVYENILAGVNSGLPEVTPARWLDIAPTNKWAMFDNKIGTVTTVPLDLTVVLKPNSTSGLAAFGLIGKTLQIKMKDVTGGTVVYDKTIQLDGTTIDSFYDWFFEDYQQLSDITITDLPSQYFNPELTFKLATSSGNVSCGTLTTGKVYTLGQSQYGATVGIISYSTKQTDDFGNITITKRQNSKRNNLKLMTEKSMFNRTYSILADLDSVPCVYIGTESLGYEPMIVYGFWKDFSIDIAYPTMNLTNIEIEGLI